MIEVVGADWKKSAAPLIESLPQLWRESEQHNMLRCAILTTLKQLVIALGVSFFFFLRDFIFKKNLFEKLQY